MKYWRAYDVSNDCVIYIPQEGTIVQPITPQHRDMLREKANQEGQKVQDLQAGRTDIIPEMFKQFMPEEMVKQLTSSATDAAQTHYQNHVEALDKALKATALFRTTVEVVWCKDVTMVDEQVALEDLIPNDVDDFMDAAVPK